MCPTKFFSDGRIRACALKLATMVAFEVVLTPGNQSGNVGEIKVTNSSIILDNSGGTNAPYFNPSPTDTSGSTFYDKDGNVIKL